MELEKSYQDLNCRTIELKAGKAPFEVQFYHPDQPAKAVVLVDGVDAQHDSNELFFSIKNQLPHDTLSIAADLSGVTRNSGCALPLSKQARRLNVVMEYAQDRFDLPRVVFIGKSLGALTIALAKPQKSEVLLLNPPMDLGSALESLISPDVLSDYEPSAYFDEEPRQVNLDLSMIEAGDVFWNELKTMNTKSLFEQLAKRNEVNMIFSGDGPNIDSQPVSDGIRWALLIGADPNFTGSHRQDLLKLLQNYCQLDIAERRALAS